MLTGTPFPRVPAPLHPWQVGGNSLQKFGVKFAKMQIWIGRNRTNDDVQPSIILYVTNGGEVFIVHYYAPAPDRRGH